MQRILLETLDVFLPLLKINPSRTRRFFVKGLQPFTFWVMVAY